MHDRNSSTINRQIYISSTFKYDTNTTWIYEENNFSKEIFSIKKDFSSNINFTKEEEMLGKLNEHKCDKGIEKLDK